MDCQFICETTDAQGELECDSFLQDCPEGQKCAAWAEDGGGSWNALKCVPLMGDKQPGEDCFAPDGGTNGLDDCAEGVMCWNVDENKMGQCVALCSGTPEAPVCPENVACIIPSDGVLNLCMPNCDPLIQDCPGDDSCIPNGDAFVCVLDASGDEGQVNDGCEFANACDKGLICLDTAEASSACDRQAAGCCGTLQTPYFNFGLSGGSAIGWLQIAPSVCHRLFVRQPTIPNQPIHRVGAEVCDRV